MITFFVLNILLMPLPCRVLIIISSITGTIISITIIIISRRSSSSRSSITVEALSTKLALGG